MPSPPRTTVLSHGLLLLFLATFLCLALHPRVAFASDVASSTAELAQTHKSLVVQIRILENSSQTKASIGSGFFVSPAGHIVTNYHVIAQLIQFPNLFQAECVLSDGTTLPLRLLEVDVVHDLALVKAEFEPTGHFTISTAPPSQGQRVFAMGNPLDLGFTIVEGTYNGLLEESLYEKIHFTGSLNGGMSGGPAIESSGQVIGVNVATSGNQVSFLVPAKYVKSLIERGNANLEPPLVEQLTTQITEQLTANQTAYLERLLSEPTPTVRLSHYSAPGRLSSAFKCWSQSNEEEERPYSLLSFSCSTQDEIFLFQGHETGVVSFYHMLLSSEKLNRFQFFNMYERFFEDDRSSLSGEENGLTNFRCKSEFVETGGISFKTGICVRGYKRVRGLYDVVLKAASVMANNEGLQTTLVLSGVSFENAQRFVSKYLQEFAWNP